MHKRIYSSNHIAKKSFFLLSLASFVLFLFSFTYLLFLSDYKIDRTSSYSTERVGYENLSTIIDKEPLSVNDLLGGKKLVAKSKIGVNFIAKTNNLGTISIAFDTHRKIINDKIIFRLKEKGEKDWYYQATYNTNQFQHNVPFPIGFPVITESQGKKYIFEIGSLMGKPNNSVSISKEYSYFLTKYKFSKKELLSDSSKLSQFLILKMDTKLAFFSTREIAVMLIFAFSPFIYYFHKYIFRNLLKLRQRVAIFQSLNLKKYFFYLTTILGILLFLLNGLITRGANFYNLFFIPSHNDYFMDFFNPLASLFHGPYSYNSIYPPFPLLLYRLLLRFVPFEIVEKGPSVIRATQAGQIVFLLYMLVTLCMFFVLIMEIKKGKALEKYIFTFVILLSAPFLHQFERANIIFVALLFLMIFVFFKDSKNRFVKELALISLAVASSIKIYPAIFGLLLIKEKRFKDALRTTIYGISLFFLPFFALGGIGQLPLFLKNVLSTSDETTKWGFGYAVNIQNITRIIFGFIGYFGSTPIIIGKFLSFIALIFGLVISFIIRSKWKTTTMLTLLMIMVPSISYEYVLIFMIIPLIMFLDREEKEKKIEYLYLACFILIFSPFIFGGIDFLNSAFRQKQFLPITYAVLIQNIAILVMMGALMWEEWMGNKLKPVRKFLGSLVSKTSSHLTRFYKFYWVIPVFVILIYNLVFFNKYYPITEGWFSTYAWLMQNGQFPYRDFYFFLTPLYLIKMNIFTTLFGYNILNLRIFGILIVLLMTYFLYKNLEIIFGTSIAAFVAIVGMIYYQSGVAHITYDFTQFVALYALIQSFLLLKYINNSDTKEASGIKWIFWAGIFASFTFFTKQSNGLILNIFSFAGLFLLSLHKERKEILRICLSYIAGFIVPMAIILLWLFANSALSQFYNQAFSSAVSAKGGLMQIFFGWFKEILTYSFIARFGEIVFIMFIFGYWIFLFRSKKKSKDETANRLIMLAASFTLMLMVLLPFFKNAAILGKLSRLGQMGTNHIIVASISTSVIAIFTAALFFLLKRPFNKSLILLSFISLGFIYGTGTSAGLSEAGVFFGFCILVGLILYNRSILGLGKIFIIFFCISFSLLWIEAKYTRPYYWWNATSSDIRGELQSTDKIKILHGMYTSEYNIKLIEEVSSEIRSGSKPEEPVLTFPNIPIFYLIADRKPPGKTIVHWFDFLPDKMAMKEAEAIRKNPPKVIVYLDLGPSVWEAHEQLFRDAKPSGQREIVRAFREVIRSENMHVSKNYALPNDVNLTVWRK